MHFWQSWGFKSIKEGMLENVARVGLAFKAKLNSIKKIGIEWARAQTKGIGVLNLATQNNLEGYGGIF